MLLEMDVALFQAVARWRPIGVHKHFRLIQIARFINNRISTPLTIEQIWERLSKYYDLDALDARADDLSVDGECSHEDVSKCAIYPFTQITEFILPFEEFDNVILSSQDSHSNPNTPDFSDQVSSSSLVSSLNYPSSTDSDLETKRSKKSKRKAV